MTPTCTTHLYIHSHFYSHAPSIPMQKRARMSLISDDPFGGAFLPRSLFLVLALSPSHSLFISRERFSRSKKSPRVRDKIRHSGMQPGRETTRSNVPRWRKLVRRPRPTLSSREEMPDKPLCRRSSFAPPAAPEYGRRARGIYWRALQRERGSLAARFVFR